MRIEQEKVEMFMVKQGLTVREKPTLIPIEEALARYQLMQEELDEYKQAIIDGDLVKIADGLADTLYTVLGTAVSHGIDAQPVFDEVHRSNMTKQYPDPITKIGGKGPDYQPPRIADLLLIQATGLANAIE